jgi:hypothetical protein
VKQGTVYGPDYVNKLFNMISRNTTRPFRFVCFTERRTGIDERIETRPLPYMLRGWWCKIPLFAPPPCIEDAQIVAIDLDVVVTGNIDWLMDWRGDFCGLSAWTTANGDMTRKYYNGSLWSLRPGAHKKVWENFVHRGDEIMKTYYSDQEYISEQILNAPTFDELFPGKILGFNTDWWNLQPEHRPDAMKTPLWVFHGFPKPSEAYKKVEWIREHWQ